MSLVNEYNAAIFDNERVNASYNENILDLFSKLPNIDVAYFDPPYCNSHADYQSFYHLLETYVNYWKDKKFINGIRRYEPKKYSGFDKKCDIKKNISRLFDLAADIPVWLVSYNDRSFPPPQDLIKIIKCRRKIQIEHYTYISSRGGKGSVAGSKEYLFIGIK